MDFFRDTLTTFMPHRKEPSKEEASLPVTDRSQVPPNREVIFSWEAPARTYTPRTPAYFKRVISIVFVLAVILILAGQIALLILIVSVVVLVYVLSSVPPERVKHEIDNYGIFYLGKQYYWSEFKFFFITHENGFDILNIDTKEPYPGRLIMLLDGVTVDKAKELLSQKLPMREGPQETVLDKAYKKIANKLSLE